MSYPGLLGFREVAGLPTEDGGRVRSGLLYRSGTPQFLSPADARALRAATGIRTVVDLRLPHETALEGSGPLADLVPVTPVPVGIAGLVAADSAVAPMPVDDPLVGNYLNYLLSDAAAPAAFANALAAPDALPALVHCTVGKDRTGAMVALLLDAVGVRRSAIAAEYAAGEAEVAPAMERLRGMATYGDAVDVYPPEAWTSPPEVALRFLAAVDARYGGSRALLARHGAGADTLAALTARLVERGGQVAPGAF